MILPAGIERVVYLEGYPDPLSEDMLKESEVKVERFSR